MPQYLVAVHHPDNYDPSAEGEEMFRDIDVLNEEMEAAGVEYCGDEGFVVEDFVQGPYNSGRMKPNPAPSVPGETDWQRFDNAVRNIFKVPEEVILKERERMEAERAKKRAKKAK